MDFTDSESTVDLRDLTRRIATSVVTPHHLSSLNGSFDTELWKQLADSGLLGTVVAANGDEGGLGLGFVDATTVTHELGRVLAAVPFGSTCLAAGGYLRRVAPNNPIVQRICDGSEVIALALEEDHRNRRRPATQVVDGTLSGEKVNVAYGVDATSFLVSYDANGATRIALVDATARGVTSTPVAVTGEVPTATVQFDKAPIIDSYDEATYLDELATVAVCADQCGVTERALELTADYAREREQFGRPIGSFQAVAQRLADGYIDCRALSLTTIQAAWLLDQLDDATPATDAGERPMAIDVAKYWAAQTGHRVAHTAVHVHGGVGLDTDHITHRYFLRAKQNEFSLGTVPDRLDHLGKLIADAQSALTTS